MILSIKHKFLFVHIPKTAGTSLRTTLMRYRWSDPWYLPQALCSRLSGLSGHRLACKLPRHAKAIAAQEMLPREFYESLFKFTFVRNPWDREVSRFHHNLREYPQLMKGLDDFEAFLRFKFDPERPRMPHFGKELQSDYLVDLHGKVIVDYIARFENLHDDYNAICQRIGISAPELAHKRHSKERKDYRAYYTDATAELIAKEYARDLEILNYQF